MKRLSVTRMLAALSGFILLGTSLPGAAADGPISDLSTAASATSSATSVRAPFDVVNIYNRANVLSDDTAGRAVAAAVAIRATFAYGRGSSVGMLALQRNGAPVQLPPGGYAIPMSLSALPLNAVGALMGRDVAGVLASGSVVMGRSTADLRGAMAGDTVDLLTAAGTVVRFPIGMVADDSVVGGTEILVTPEQADIIGATLTTRILVWGFDSRDALNQALVNVGLEPRTDVRVRRSWDALDPDSQIGMAETKAKLGEFAYRVNADGIGVSVTAAWSNVYLPPQAEVFSAAIPIRSRCNVTIRGDLTAALDEVAAAGLGGAIDVANANTYGGCFNPRFNRISGSLGFLSRHSWGQALDTNTVSNAQGRTPTMNCDVVRIFRKHGFAWGGNFLTPDGMHFEWVGTRRDQYPYPSRFCPNLPTPSARPDAAAPTIGFATMLADDGLMAGETD